MEIYRFSLRKQNWQVPWVFEAELHDAAEVKREVRDLQALYTLEGEQTCAVVFERRASFDPKMSQGRRVMVDWSVPSRGPPDVRGQQGLSCRASGDLSPVEGNLTLGVASETLRVDLEAECASVSKRAFVTEEVKIGRRTETETQCFTEPVGREVLDVNKTGDVGSGATSTASGVARQGESLLEKAEAAITGAMDKLDNKR